MKSKTTIEKQLRKKTSSDLVETIIAAKKKAKWTQIAGLLSASRRKRPAINLSEIEKQAKEGKRIIVPGKILSQGELTKKIKIAALGFSDNAKEKLKNSGSEGVSILEEIKSNPEAKDIQILK